MMNNYANLWWYRSIPAATVDKKLLEKFLKKFELNIKKGEMLNFNILLKQHILKDF